MINFKKIDETDFVFISKPLTKEEEKDFSSFLKAQKEKKKRASVKRNTVSKS